MMRSVSMSSRSKGIAVPMIDSIFCMATLRELRGSCRIRIVRDDRAASYHYGIENLANVGDATVDGRGRNHRGTHQEGPAHGASLPSLEVAVARRGANLA